MKGFQRIGRSRKHHNRGMTRINTYPASLAPILNIKHSQIPSSATRTKCQHENSS